MKVKKIISKFIVFISLIAILMPAPLNTFAEEEEVKDEKGDLRCPESTPNGVVCRVTKYEGGKPAEVEIVYGSVNNPGDVEIVKTVSKTDTLGELSVKFRVRGKNIEQPKVPEPVYVIMAIDMSATISGKEKKAIAAAKSFAKRLIPSNGAGNINLAVMQFASNNKVRREFAKENLDNVDFLKYNTGKLGKRSHLEKAIQEALNKFSTVVGKKYFFLFGDGRYYSDDDTDVSGTFKKAKELREAGITIYTLRYKGISASSTFGWKAQANHVRCFGNTYGMCDTKNMVKLICGDVYKDAASCSGSLCGASCESFNSLPSRYKYAPSEDDFERFFLEVAEGIAGESGGTRVVSPLEDKLGEYFQLADDTLRTKTFDVGDFGNSSSGVTTDPFNIVIDENASTGWHDTNSGFSLTYTDTSGKEVTINCNTNPQLYWVRSDHRVPGCAGETSANDEDIEVGEGKESIYDINKTVKYYEIECLEGYKENGIDKPGYKVTFNINNLYNARKKLEDQPTHFSSGAVGFPIKIDIEANVKCRYYFNSDEFRKNYTAAENDKKSNETAIASEEASLSSLNSSISSLQREIADLQAVVNAQHANPAPPSEGEEETPAEPEKSAEELALEAKRSELSSLQSSASSLSSSISSRRRTIASLESFMVTMNKILSTYSDKVSKNYNNLNEYKDIFSEQTALVRVSYLDTTDADEITLKQTGDINGSVGCKNVKSETINGVSIVNKTCTANLSKTLEMPEVCLSMKNGEQVECSSAANDQINADKKFYANLDYEGGNISISIRNAGYHQKLDFLLSGDGITTCKEPIPNTDGCSFCSQKMDIMYRQVDIDDPFIQDKQPDREIGKNYVGTKYNFENIINGDLWDTTDGTPKYNFEYRYNLGKENVANIRKDTDNNTMESYLGSNCYFNANNKYVCEFTRSAENGDNTFFSSGSEINKWNNN